MYKNTLSITRGRSLVFNATRFVVNRN